jgi:hypothetical protein
LTECGYFGRARSFRPDTIALGKGPYIKPSTLSAIKQETGATLINYATDAPFNRPVSTADLVASIPLYDIYACTKRAIMDDVAHAGGRVVIYVPFGYKPEVHFPETTANEVERRRFKSDVAFIGGCDSERARTLIALVQAIPNLNLALYGQYWDRWPRLRRYWRGFALGRDFRLALNGTKIALNFVRHANRDDHTMRAFEITACRAFMLAERTDSHLQFFPENVAAGYFDGSAELIASVKRFLADPFECERLSKHANHSLSYLSCRYEDRLVELLSSARDLTS